MAESLVQQLANALECRWIHYAITEVLEGKVPAYAHTELSRGYREAVSVAESIAEIFKASGNEPMAELFQNVAERCRKHALRAEENEARGEKAARTAQPITEADLEMED